MNIGLIIILIVASAILFAGISATVFLYLKRKDSAILGNSLEDKIARISGEALKNNTEQFLTYAREILGAQKNEIKVDLEGKKSAINELINEIRKDLHKNEERISRYDEERIKSYSALSKELQSYKEITGDLKVSTDKLKDLLSNNQMRGAFGESVADNLLKMAGFVVGQDYVRNEAQQTESTRPDFTIFLPDQTKVNIDVKFPYTALVKYVETEDKTEKDRYLKAFKQDVKTKIKQVCTRDYINPSEKTVDFVILFIPNEMIFSFIYDKMNDVWEEAMAKKVILAGPFSFTAILRMVKQAYTNFRYQENLQHIISLIQKFDIEYQKFSDEFNKLGDRINLASRQFDTVSNTRNRQLTTIVDKIKNQNIIEVKDQIDLIENPDD